MRFRASPIALALILAGLCSLTRVAGATEEVEIHLPDATRPPVLDRIDLPDDLQTLTIDASGRQAAVALRAEPGERRSTVLLYGPGPGEPRSIKLPGEIRDLLFAPGDGSVLALVHRPAKHREGDAQLMRIDPDRERVERVQRLPPSAMALDFWLEKRVILVAARNEIRTLALPGYRSGPLFRVPGDNLAVASLGQRGRIIVGQKDRLLLVNLNDPPGESAMPIRDSVTTPEPVVSLSASADGTRVLARTADGAIRRVGLVPIRLGELTDDRLSAAVPEQPLAPPERLEPPPEPTAAVAETFPAPPADLPPQRREPVQESAPEPEPPSAAKSEARSDPERESQAETPLRATPRPPAGSGPEAGPPRLRGRIAGPAAADVLAVVVLGPDNVLREARRVRPGPDGRWTARDLPRGRYRVQLDGGGDRVLVTEPRYLTIDLAQEGAVDVPEIRVLEAR